MTEELRNAVVEALTESEVKKLETVVQQEVEKEQRDELRKKYKEQYRRKMRQQLGAEEGLVEVFINVAKHSNGITIDGVMYQHGKSYKVKQSLAGELWHIMQCTDQHQSEVDGKRKDYYTREKNTRIGPQGVVNASQLLRV